MGNICGGPGKGAIKLDKEALKVQCSDITLAEFKSNVGLEDLFNGWKWQSRGEAKDEYDDDSWTFFTDIQSGIL